MKIVISPAKSLDFTRNFEKPFTTTACFINEADYLASKLKKVTAKKLGKMMHISDELAELNHERYQHWQLPVEESETAIPSIFAFTGEVYRGLEAETLSMSEMEQAQNQLLVLSGLYGLLKPLDLMYPYRLEMGTKWQITPKTPNLYSFWSSKITQKLNEELKNESDPVVINLASTEYFKAVDKKKLKAKVITPVFKELKGNEYKIVMMYAKHARGAMARYIIQNGLTDPEQLKLYQVDGYQWDANLSTENEWVFTR